MEAKVKRLTLCNNHDYMTHADTCGCDKSHHYTRFCVVGTAYGHLHTRSGDMRLWNTYSGAYKAAKQYAPF